MEKDKNNNEKAKNCSLIKEKLKMEKANNFYMPFSGGTIYGFGIVRNKRPDERNKHSKVFENRSGKIFFDDFKDRQVRGIKEVRDLK